jgi:hypothetical protein
MKNKIVWQICILFQIYNLPDPMTYFICCTLSKSACVFIVKVIKEHLYSTYYYICNFVMSEMLIHIHDRSLSLSFIHMITITIKIQQNLSTLIIKIWKILKKPKWNSDIVHIISQFSSVFSISLHYSTYFSSVFLISFHYSTHVSSISFHYSTYFSSIISKSFHYSTYDLFSSNKMKNKIVWTVLK